MAQVKSLDNLLRMRRPSYLDLPESFFLSLADDRFFFPPRSESESDDDEEDDEDDEEERERRRDDDPVGGIFNSSAQYLAKL